MKLLLGSLSLVLLGLAASAPAAHAESSYWEDRWQGHGYYDKQAYPRHRAEHPSVTIRKRPRELTQEEQYARRSYNGPVYGSQEEVQQSIYEFSTGGFGNIKSYR